MLWLRCLICLAGACRKIPQVWNRYFVVHIKRKLNYTIYCHCHNTIYCHCCDSSCILHCFNFGDSRNSSCTDLLGAKTKSQEAKVEEMHHVAIKIIELCLQF